VEKKKVLLIVCFWHKAGGSGSGVSACRGGKVLEGEDSPLRYEVPIQQRSLGSAGKKRSTETTNDERNGTPARDVTQS